MTVALQIVPDVTPAPRLKKALIADLFCGAGGTSTGAQRALIQRGYRMDLTAVNHWPLAVETHTKNHPDARHYCQDIATLRPIVAVPEGKLDLLCASPTCTYHSRARGGRPTSDQQRQDPWHIVTWLTELRVKRLLIENVPEFLEWGPIDPRTGRPIKARRGEYFQSWVRTLEGIGMRVEWRVLNAADYGDATTRQRFFLIGRSDGKRIRWPLPTHSRTGSGLPGIAETKKWRAAREIIDWDLHGRSIFDRKKPLSPKTLARIYAGAVKFKWPEPFLVILRQHMDAQSVDGPLPTVTAGGTHIGLAQPLASRLECPFCRKQFARDLLNEFGDESDEDYLRCPACRSANLRTAGTFVLPHVRGGGCAPRSADLPIPTVTGGGKGGGPGYLVEPVTMAPGQGAARETTDPLQTITAEGGRSIALVEPFVLSQASGGSPRSVEDPVPTSTTGGNGGSHALIAPYYGSTETCTSPEKPLPTVTTKERFGLVVPVTHTESNNRARDVEQPLPTLTTAKGGEHAIVMPVTHEGGDRVRSTNDPLPTVTGAHRGELAFIAAQFGEREGQTPRVHSVDEPMPTLCAEGRVQLVEGRQYDILFRMLEPHELAAAMGFSDEETQYEFAGTKTHIIKQIGNAVPVHLAEALVGALFDDERQAS